MGLLYCFIGVVDKEQAHSFKSLQGHNYFMNKFVGQVKHLKTKTGVDVFLADVRHSQSMTKDCVPAWVAIQNSMGVVLVVSAHCQCMAG